jgi:DNA-binding transcriptional LysR family regulator
MGVQEHLEKLAHFCRTVDFRSLNEASKAIGISQAGLSKSINSLERAIGSRLFVRSSDGLVLTKEGEMVLVAARRILGEASKLEISLLSLQAPTSPKVLKIGMYDSIAVYFFSSLREYLSAIYPEMRIQLQVDSSARMKEAVLSIDVDLAIGVNLNTNNTLGTKYSSLFEDHYSFYVSPKLESVTEKTPLLIHPTASDLDGVSVESHLVELIRQRGAHRVHNFETLKVLATQSLGIGVLPTQVAKPLIDSRQLKTMRLPRTKQLFGKHEIGFLATTQLLSKHERLVSDLYRLGQLWSK